ncbi:MAG: sodium-dependent transporter [Clostridia bacterium]|nr:sodium-dependent transporter [Clostridia bacterium]
MARERLGSRLGFILLSAGCAIGIGNVWKFPWMVGSNGGGIFVLIYLFFLIVMGVPVMTMEFAIGRAAQKSPAVMHAQLAPKKPIWQAHGWASLIGSYLLMMFYTTVTGWMLNYFVKMAAGDLEGVDYAAANAAFGNMVSNPWMMILYMGIAVAIGAGVCSFSLQKGLERVTKYMMLALIVIMVVLAVNSCFTKGGAEGLKFYLMPSVENLKTAGVGNVIVSAMNQAFFTLSLGIGSMAIFGSYLGKEHTLMGESVRIAGLDTFVAFTSGLIIFPACMAYDIPVDAGPNLIFVTLPTMFANLPLGRLWGSLFFVFMSFAALSTVLAVFENIMACTMDLFHITSRKKACLINGIVLFVLSVPCVLGFSVWSGFTPFGAGSNILDLEDFIVSNVLLPLGAMLYVIFCTTRYGWGWDNFTAEANMGKGLKVQKWMRFYVTFILPIIIAILFVIGIVTKFWGA